MDGFEGSLLEKNTPPTYSGRQVFKLSILHNSSIGYNGWLDWLPRSIALVNTGLKGLLDPDT